MAIRPSRTIQGLKTSAEYDRSAGANTRRMIEARSQASGGKSRRGGGALTGLATGALATRDVPMTGDDQGPPMQDKQTPLRATAASPNYTPGSLMDVIAGNRTGETNPNFDSSKAIGGDNVPYKETTGVGGFFKRVFGNKANELNAAAQREQGAEWKADEREAKRLAREDEVEARRAAREDERFNKQQEIIDARRRGDREYQALDNIFEQARRSDEKQQDIALAEQRRRDELAYRKSVDDANAAIAAKKLALDEKVANATIAKNQTPKRAPRYNSLGGGILEDVETGEVFRAREGSPGMGKIPAVQGGLIPLKRATPPPAASVNDVPVDPATGQPLRMQQAPAVQPIPSDVRQPTFAVMPANNRQVVAAADEMSIDPYELQKLEENPPLNWNDEEEKKRQKMSPAKYLSSGMQQGWRIN